MAVFLIFNEFDLIQDLLRHFLQRAGIKVTVAENIAEINEIISNDENVSIIIRLDKNTKEKCTEIQSLASKNADLKVVGFSKRDLSDEELECIKECGVKNFYKYPCDWASVIDEIKVSLEE